MAALTDSQPGTSRGLDLLKFFSTDTRLTRFILYAFLVSRAVAVFYTVQESGNALLNWCGYLLFVAITLTTFRPRPLSRWDLAALLFGFTSVSLMVESVLPFGRQETLGWHYAGITIVAFCLALRGHQVTAVLGYLIVLLIGLVVPSLIGGAEPALVLDGRVRNLVIIVIAAVASAVLGWMDRRLFQVWRDTGIRRAQGAALTEASRTRRRRLMQVIAQSDDVLAEIGSERPLDAWLRRESAILEASLRDGIRGRRLATGQLAEAAEAARRRGATVVMLDDGPAGIDPDGVSRAVEWGAGMIESMPSGTAVVRLLPGNQMDIATCVITPPVQASAGGVPAEPALYSLRGPDPPRRLLREERRLGPRH